mgnify:CR=1 FL=1
MVKKTENMALEETRSVLHDLEIQKKSIKKQLECGIINSVDASQEEENIMTKERKLKKQLVSAVHVTKDGQPRKIEYKDSKGLYMTILPDKKKIYGKTEEILIDKLFDYYGLAISDVSIAGVFELALAEKQTTQNVNPETIKRDRQTFNRFIISDFGARDIREISKVELRAYTQEMVQRIHPIETAFKAYKGILNLIFVYALEYGIIKENPVPFVKNAVYLKGCERTKAKAENKILSKEEIDLVTKTVRSRMTQNRYHGYFILGYAILLSVETGMRVGELCALKWEDVSLEKKNVYVHKTMQRLSNYATDGPRSYIEISTPKSKCSFRKIPLPDALIDYIQENYPDQHGYVLTSSEDKYLEPRTMQKHFRLIQQKCGLDPVKFHSLRHTFATRCVELDFDIKSLSEILGHATVNITLNRYVHPSMELKQQNMQKMSALMKDLSKIP